MKYSSRKEQRTVCETVNSILAPMIPHLLCEDAEAVKIAIRILNAVEVEEKED